MEHVPHARRRRVGEHHEPQAARRLVVVELVLPRAVADEGVVVAAQLAHHAAEGEDGAEDELRVVARPRRLGPSVRGTAFVAAAACAGRRVLVCVCVRWRIAEGRGDPGFRVYTFR